MSLCNRECLDCNHANFEDTGNKSINVYCFTCVNGTVVKFKYISANEDDIKNRLRKFFEKRGDSNEQIGTDRKVGSNSDVL